MDGDMVRGAKRAHPNKYFFLRWLEFELFDGGKSEQEKKH